MKPASYVGEPEVRCSTCGVKMLPAEHEHLVMGPVEALQPGGTTVDDWRREAHWRSLRRGQYADISIYPDVDNDEAIDILVARVLHFEALHRPVARSVA